MNQSNQLVRHCKIKKKYPQNQNRNHKPWPVCEHSQQSIVPQQTHTSITMFCVNERKCWSLPRDNDDPPTTPTATTTTTTTTTSTTNMSTTTTRTHSCTKPNHLAGKMKRVASSQQAINIKSHHHSNYNHNYNYHCNNHTRLIVQSLLLVILLTITQLNQIDSSSSVLALQSPLQQQQQLPPINSDQTQLIDIVTSPNSKPTALEYEYYVLPGTTFKLECKVPVEGKNSIVWLRTPPVSHSNSGAGHKSQIISIRSEFRQGFPGIEADFNEKSGQYNLVVHNATYDLHEGHYTCDYSPLFTRSIQVIVICK